MPDSAFKETYKNMMLESLMELTLQMDDLVPEAKFALLAELLNRGKTKDDIAQYGHEQKGESTHGEQLTSQVSGSVDTDGKGGVVSGPSRLLEGPVPPDWTLIPCFGFEESFTIAGYLEERKLDTRITPTSSCGTQQYCLVVHKDRFQECIEAVKDFFESSDSPAELFSGPCPACGAEQTGVKECADCGIILSQDNWEANQRHPFVKFLLGKGLGKCP